MHIFKSYLFFLSLLFWLISCGKDNMQPLVPPSNSGSIPSEVLKLINEYRKSQGLSDLVMNDIIAQEAQTHSNNMAAGRVKFSHDGFAQRAKNILNGLGTNITNRNVAENVGFGSSGSTIQRIVDEWVKSPGHKANILGNHELTGIGTAKDSNGSTFYTQIFL